MSEQLENKAPIVLVIDDEQAFRWNMLAMVCWRQAKG